MIDDKMNKMWYGAAMVLAMAVLMMTPTLAFALPSFGFDYKCTDRSISDYLAPIFGSLFSRCGGGAGGSGLGFERAMGVLNAGALTFGGMLAAYTLVVGTMQTAHDGEMLGKKWSSMWLPIRTVLGVGLVVPISNGYCVAQLLIAFMIGQGVGFADSVWSMYLTTFVTPMGMAPTNRLPSVTDLAKGILTSQVCVAGYNALQAKSPSIYPNPMSMTSPPTGGSPITVFNFGLPSAGGSGGNECGSVTYKKSNQTVIDAATGLFRAQSSQSAQAMGLGTVANDAVNSVNTSPVDLAQMSAARAMIGRLQTTASKIVSFRDSQGAALDVVGDMNIAIVEYQAAVSKSVTAVFGNQDAMKIYVTAAENDGWYLAGAWFMKAAQLQDMVNVTVSNVPTTTAPNPSSLGNDSALIGAMTPYFSQMEKIVAGGAPAIGAASTDAATTSTGNPLKMGIGKISEWIGEAVFNRFALNPSRSAVMSIKDIGDGVMTAAETSMIAGVAMVAGAQGTHAANASIAGQLAGLATLGFGNAGAGATAGALSVVGYMLIIIGSLFFGLGSMIAVYLPFAPFLLYFGAFVGWLILCGEAIIAAPIWAVMHLTPSGDDVMGGARQGYMLILGLLFRPVLIVLGFIFALTAVNVVVQGFNGVFFPAFKLAMTGSVMGLGTILVMLCIYFGTMVWLFHTIFGLIHVIPDKLLRWIGGGGEGLGETARGISKAGESGAGTAARHSDAIRQNMMTGMQTANQLNNANKSRVQGLGQAENSAAMQEKAASSKAAIAESKAAASGKPDEQLAAVGAHIQTAAAAANKAKAGLEAKGVDPYSAEGSDKIGKAQEKAMETDMGKASEIASQMQKKAGQLEGNFNAQHAENKDPASIATAAEETANQYNAAASAQDMLGNKKGGNTLREKATEVTNKATTTPEKKDDIQNKVKNGSPDS